MVAAMWTEGVEPASMSWLPRWLAAGEDRLDTVHARAYMALRLAKSWYQNLDLDKLVAQRDGLEVELQAVEEGLRVRANDIASYDAWDELNLERVQGGNVIPEDLHGLQPYDADGISDKAAHEVLEQLSGQSSVFSKARYTVRSFGIRPNEKIACYVTIRGEKAMQLLESGLKVKELLLRCVHCYAWSLASASSVFLRRSTTAVLFGIGYKITKSQHDEFEAKIFEERAALESKYQKMYEPLYSKHHDVVNGVVEVEGVTKDDSGEAAVDQKGLE
ncbi:60S ribosomal protein L11 [Hordeum vulgare]|nr:60S ribosomal protein L11 [Hordeum vulgare]